MAGDRTERGHLGCLACPGYPAGAQLPQPPCGWYLNDDRILRADRGDLELAIPVHAQPMGAGPGTRLIERHCWSASALPDRSGYLDWRHIGQRHRLDSPGTVRCLAGLDQAPASQRPTLGMLGASPPSCG